jgi:hypothetical protein
MLMMLMNTRYLLGRAKAHGVGSVSDMNSFCVKFALRNFKNAQTKMTANGGKITKVCTETLIAVYS